MFQRPGQGAKFQTAQKGEKADNAFRLPVPYGGEHADGEDGASQLFPYFPYDGVPGILPWFHFSAGEFVKKPVGLPRFLFGAQKKRASCGGQFNQGTADVQRVHGA